jgi:6,7-dimethyl-8-ribityllumazine synthase
LTEIMSKDKPDSLAIDGEGCHVGIIAARYNFQMVNALLETVLNTLGSCGVRSDDIEVFRVPGSNEIPHAAAMAAKTGSFDVVIALGLIIEGDTDHHSIIGHATAGALQAVGINFEIPVINGIITVRNEEQAEARITGDLDRGAEFAHAALEMAQLNEALESRIFEDGVGADFDDLDWPDDVTEPGDNPEDWQK